MCARAFAYVRACIRASVRSCVLDSFDNVIVALRLRFCLSFYLHPNLIFASSQVSGESTYLRRLAFSHRCLSMRCLRKFDVLARMFCS